MINSRITSITIENFKGISKPVTVSLKPITLLFGKNSAGKSTILQAMLYALEVIRTGEADIDVVQLGGDVVHLGGFKNIVHKHDLSNKVRLRFDLQLGEFGLESFDKYEGLFPDLENDALGNVKSAYVAFEISDIGSNSIVSRYSTGINGVEIASIKNLFNCEIVDINYCHPIFVAVELDDLAGALANYWNYDLDRLDFSNLSTEEIDELREGFSENVPALCSSTLDMACGIPKLDTPLPFKKKDETGDEPDDVDGLLLHQRKTYELFFSRCLVRPLDALFDQLNRMRYIGPIRAVPVRDYQPPLIRDTSRWASGLAAWDELHDSPVATSASKSGLITTANYYIEDVLDLGYRLNRYDSLEIDTSGALIKTLKECALHLEDVDADYFRDVVLQRLEEQPIRKMVSLIDIKNNVEVDPCDIGVGVSQVIPVIIGALAKTEAGKRPSVFSVEQPELHTHPAVQCALGDLFIREKSDDHIFLLETHSEHLLLRIMKRMRQCAAGELPPDIPDVSKEDVAVLFVENINGVMLVRDMPLNERGELVKAWPGGFFEEGLQEVY